MQTSEKIIQESISGKWINALAFFYYAKRFVKNSRYYGISRKDAIKNLSLKTGKSLPTCKKYISILHSKGLVRFDGNHITFISQQKARALFNKGKGVFHLCTIGGTTFSEIKRGLYTRLLEQNIRQEQYMISRNQRIKGRVIPNGENLESKTVLFTNDKLCKLLNISKATVQKQKRFMLMDGSFHIQRIKPKFIRRVEDGFNPKELLTIDNKSFFVHKKNGKSNLFQSFATQYTPLRYV